MGSVVLLSVGHLGMAKNKTYQKSANNARKRSNAAKESSDRHWRDLADMKQTAEVAAVKLEFGQNRQRKRVKGFPKTRSNIFTQSF